MLTCLSVCWFEQAFSLVRCRLHVLSQLLSVVVPRQCRLQRFCHALGLPLAARVSPGPGDGLCCSLLLSALLRFFRYRKCMWQLEVEPGTVWLIHKIWGSLAEILAIHSSSHIPLYWFLCPERWGFSVLLQVTGLALRRGCKRQEKEKNNVNSPHSLFTIRMAFSVSRLASATALQNI